MPSFARLASVGAILKAVAPALRPGSPSLGSAPGPCRASCEPRSTVSTPGPKGRLALMLAATGYIVSPLDLIPEGGVPDPRSRRRRMVLSWLASRFVEETEDFLEWEARRREDAVRGDLGPVGPVGHVGHVGAGRVREPLTPRARGPGPRAVATRPPGRRPSAETSSPEPRASTRSTPTPTREGALRPSTGGRGAVICPQIPGGPSIVRTQPSRKRGAMTADITLRGPGDVLAVLPYQLGYHPSSCVVAVSLRGPVGSGSSPAPTCRPRSTRAPSSNGLVGPLLTRRGERPSSSSGTRTSPTRANPPLIVLVERLERDWGRRPRRRRGA